MKKIYIDCTGGVSGDMIARALTELAACVCGAEPEKPVLPASGHEYHHDHHDHRHGRSLQEVLKLIEGAENAGGEAKAFARGIYEVIAAAEAKVHERTLETVHFHEVGRDEAVLNALTTGAALEAMGFSAGGEGEILVSPVYDGRGWVDCAHGRIPVPVPAVRAMMDRSDFEFRTAEEVDTEMVTPSGLAALMGIGGRPAGPEEDIREKAACVATCEGKRKTGRDGLKVYYTE